MVRSAKPPTMVPKEAEEFHPQLGASMTPKIRTVIPAADSVRPRQSIGGVLGSREAGTETATSAAIPAATTAMKAKMLPHQ